MTLTALDWDHYRTFLAVMREGSQSAAARALGLTQPTVARHVDALEAAVGRPLFVRSQQGLLPTETAVEMQPYAEAMAANAAALARAATGSGDTVTGTVRISASEVVGLEVLPPMLSALQDKHPGLQVELSISDVVEDLLRQEADIAVRMVAPTQAALVSRKIGAIPLGFHAHRRYLERQGVPTTLADLALHRLIGFDRQLAYVRAMAQRMPEVAAMRFAFRTDSNVAQLAMIRAAGGIGICQRALAARDPDLIEVLPGLLDMKLETYLVMHENLKSAPRCRVTFDALVESFLHYIA